MNERHPVLTALSLVFRSKLFALLFTAVLFVPFASAQNGGGIGFYDLKSTADLAFAFDYNGTGVADHIVLYRPGAGAIQIVGSSNGVFQTVFSSNNGIGFYDLMSADDRIFAFDYDGSGLKDHLVCYRPGAGIIYILANVGGTFTPVFTSNSGVGGYDLSSTSDVMAAFDYDSSGLADHLVAYRPGSGMIQILQNSSGTFSPVFQSTTGVSSYDLSSSADRILPFDYYGTGVADHLVMYRPGAGMVSIMENSNGTFTPVYQSSSGIGGYDLKVTSDQLFTYDYDGYGTLNHLVAYRPGTGIVYIIGSAYFNFTDSFESTSGIGGFDVRSENDRAFTLSYGPGLLQNMVFFRPGTGTIYILGPKGSNFAPVFQDIVSAQFGLRTGIPTQ